MAPAPETAPSPNSSRTPPPKSSPPPPSSSPPPPKSPPPPSSPPPRSPPPPSPPRRSPPPPSPPKKKKTETSPPPPPSTSKRSPPPRSQTPPVAFFPPPENAARNQYPPPPPDRLHKSPSHKTHHKSSDRSHTKHSDSSNEVTIIGFALAAFVFLSVVTICVTCTRRKKKKDAAYYMKPSPGASGGGDYYKNQWGGSPRDHVVKFTTPGMMGKPVGVGGRWGTSPRSNKNGGNFSPSAMPPPNMPLAFSMSQFSYNELSVATGGFSKSNLLGQGGFGYVHKGVLPNGQQVAVKSLKSGSNQGEREFQAEVEIISRVHHRHLVSLVGYCIADAQRLLVYEHVPNKTLEFHLHGKGCPVMSWETRIHIALGSAKGLAYLHEDCDPRIIHRDIKSSNILLDHNFEAKVADFGLAKLASVEDTHISTRVMGTFGYLAPEYASSGKLTEKSDVFSFGVMLLELLTGKKPIDPTNNYMEESLVEWAGPLLVKALEDRNYNELVDPRLEGKYDPNEVGRMAAVVAASIRHSARQRPKMSQIVRALEGDGSLDALNDALKPQRTYSMVNLNQSPDMSTSIVYDTKAYNEDMRKFKEMVMSSQDFSSS